MEQCNSFNSQLDSFVDNIFNEVIEESLSTSYTENDAEAYENDKLPVDVIEFAESPEYLHLKGQMFDRVKYILAALEDPTIRESDLILGKGSGKSLLAQVFSLYGSYKALEMKNPQQLYGLTSNSSIYSINVSISQAQAKDNIFSGIEELVKKSPYFAGKYKIKSLEIELPKNIFFMCGHSNATAFLGYPTLRAVMDEANYMVDNNNRSVAQQLYTALRGSLKTRFPQSYKLLAISSDSTPNSFLRDRVNELKRAIDDDKKL